MSVFAPLLNIGISLAIFFVEGNTLVLNKILHMCVKGLYIIYMTLTTLSMLCFLVGTHFCTVNNLLLINRF